MNFTLEKIILNIYFLKLMKRIGRSWVSNFKKPIYSYTKCSGQMIFVSPN